MPLFSLSPNQVCELNSKVSHIFAYTGRGLLSPLETIDVNFHHFRFLGDLQGCYYNPIVFPCF